MVGASMGSNGEGWKRYRRKESNKIPREANEGKGTQTSLDKKTTLTYTNQTTWKQRKRNEQKQQRNTLPHLVQSRWVCASLQQQAHDLGLVLLRRHVKGRLPILQVRRRKGDEKKVRDKQEFKFKKEITQQKENKITEYGK